MPIIVSCPTCNGQLRVADDLIGRRVRCPTCQAIFEASDAPAPRPASPSPAPPPEGGTDLNCFDLPPSPAEGPPLERIPPTPLQGPDIPIETVPIKPLLNLSLDPAEPKPPAAPPVPPVPRLGPVGAVELDANGRPVPSAPPPSGREGREDRDDRSGREDRPRRPRLNDDHDDMRPCSHCGRMLHRDSRRCYGCGTACDYEDDQPRRRDGGERFGVRRDCEPHRAGLVLTLGILALVSIFILPPIGLVLGLVAWVMGQGDLKKLRAGTMDPEGEGTTQGGWICGIIATVLGGLITLTCGGLCGLGYVSSVQESKRRSRQVAPTPPPKMAPNNKF